MVRIISGALLALALSAGYSFAQYPYGMSYYPSYQMNYPYSNYYGMYNNSYRGIGGGYFGTGGYGGYYANSGFGGYGGYGYGGYGGLGGSIFASRYYSPYYRTPGLGPVVDTNFLFPGPPRLAQAQISGQFPAQLTIEFPAAANVWLDGKEISGKPESVRTITSPVIGPGQEYTFHIRAQWKANGKTYEYKRDAALGAGVHSKLLVVNGTPVEAK